MSTHFSVEKFIRARCAFECARHHEEKTQSQPAAAPEQSQPRVAASTFVVPEEKPVPAPRKLDQGWF